MPYTVLAIETSCDETAVAIVDTSRNVLSHQLLSQQEHKTAGGVIPERASRAHLQHLHLLVKAAIKEAGVGIDAIAATAGPGLIGSIVVGLMMAKSLAFAMNKPFIAVNHLEAHALVIRMANDITFPFLTLIISGGHCQFIVVEGIGIYHKIGGTLDDSLGEAFDKTARTLGLEYPGGPIIERLALLGNKYAFPLPRAMIKRPGCNFSFSGLKTAVKNIAESCQLNAQTKADICASFQYCVADILQDRICNAIEITRSRFAISHLVTVGGVASNTALRSAISSYCCAEGINSIFPQRELCTDNGVMVAWAGLERYIAGFTNILNTPPQARWPMEKMRRIAPKLYSIDNEQ